MLRFILQAIFAVLLMRFFFALARALSGRSRREQLRDARAGGPGSGDPVRGGARERAGRRGRVDPSAVTDVSFTEVPPEPRGDAAEGRG